MNELAFKKGNEEFQPQTKLKMPTVAQGKGRKISPNLQNKNNNLNIMDVNAE